MRITNNTSPLFKAKYINSAKVGRMLDSTSKYSDAQVSFVKIDPDNINDIKALGHAVSYWQYDSFGKNIYYAACALNNESRYYKGHSVYALTSQTSDFEKLKSDNILGMIHISPLPPDTAFIEYLQVNPEMIYSKTPEYKGIGTAILTSVKNFCSKIICFPASSKSVKDFYFKNGFIEYFGHSNLFVWNKT